MQNGNPRIYNPNLLYWKELYASLMPIIVYGYSSCIFKLFVFHFKKCSFLLKYLLFRSKSDLPKARQWALEMSLNVLSHSGDSPSRTSCLLQIFSVSKGSTLFVPPGQSTWFRKMCQPASIPRYELWGDEKNSLKKVNKKSFFKRLLLKLKPWKG